MINSKVLVAFVVGVTFSLSATAKMYKWLDDKGVTHYGETIPPEYANKDREELNQAGRVIRTEEVMTPERRVAKERENARKREIEKEATERNRHDKTLLSTYSSVKEIDLARSRNLQQVEARINTINSYLNTANNNLLGLQKEADGYIKKQKELPDSLKEDLSEAKSRIDKLNKDLEKPQAEKSEVEARYDNDRARFIELTGKKD